MIFIAGFLKIISAQRNPKKRCDACFSSVSGLLKLAVKGLTFFSNQLTNHSTMVQLTN